jgi:hypothetical protein
VVGRGSLLNIANTRLDSLPQHCASEWMSRREMSSRITNAPSFVEALGIEAALVLTVGRATRLRQAA